MPRDTCLGETEPRSYLPDKFNPCMILSCLPPCSINIISTYQHAVPAYDMLFSA